MIAYLKRLAIGNIVSPYGLAVVSYCLFLFAWLFPPELYTRYVGEPDLMFLDAKTFIYFTSCVAAFLIGVRFMGLWQVKDHDSSASEISTEFPLIYLVLPIAITTALCAVYLMATGSRLNSLALLASHQGNSIKVANQTETAGSKLAIAPVALTAVLWWSLFRSHQIKLDRSSKLIFYFVYAVGAAAGVAACVLTVDRTSLMPILAGSMVVYLFLKTRATDVRVGKLLIVGSVSTFSIVGGFLGFSFLRGALVLQLLLTSLLGYTIVSYNRLAAILAGFMHYEYEGRGVYLATVLMEKPGVRALFGWPDPLTLWRSEFTSTYSAGLNSFFIWSGAFGYLYSDIGWWTLLYLFFVGILAGLSWRLFRRGTVWGLVFYPWIGFSILFWLGWNLLFEGRALRFIVLAAGLWVYDRVLLRRHAPFEERDKPMAATCIYSRISGAPWGSLPE